MFELVQFRLNIAGKFLELALDERRQQQEQARMLGLDPCAGRPRRQRRRLGRSDAWRGAARLGRARGQPLQPLGAQDLPDGVVAGRAAFTLQLLGDLGDRAVGGAQLEHPVADHELLARPLGARLGGHEELELAGAQLGGQLPHRGRGVAEALADLGGAGLLEDVGAHGFVAALGRLGRVEEVLRTLAHVSGDLPERHAGMIEQFLLSVWDARRLRAA